MRLDWSDEVRRMEKELRPYFKPEGGGVMDESPKEIKELYERFREKVEEEMWM